MLTYFKAIRPRPGFTVDEPSATIPHTAELFVTSERQWKNTGRLQMRRRRPRPIREKFELGMLVDDPSLSKWTVHMQPATVGPTMDTEGRSRAASAAAGAVGKRRRRQRTNKKNE